MKANKVTSIHARATAIERAALGAIAQADGVKPSEWIRETVRREARARGLWAGLVAQQTQQGGMTCNQ